MINDDTTTATALPQVGRLNAEQVKALAETIGAAFLTYEYDSGNFSFSEAWRGQLRNFLTDGTIHEDIAYTAQLLTAPNPVINRFGESITGVEMPLTRGDIRQAYQYMLEADATVSVEDRNRLSQWISARVDGYQALNTLIAPANNANLQDFFAAVIRNDHEYVEELINNIDPSTMLENLSLYDDDGNTALHLAALHGHADMVQTLMNAGAIIELLNNNEDNVVHLAVRGGSPEILDEILSFGHDLSEVIDSENRQGRTPIALTENEAMRDVLLRHGATDNGVPARSPSPLSAKRGRDHDDDRRDGDKDGGGRGDG